METMRPTAPAKLDVINNQMYQDVSCLRKGKGGAGTTGRFDVAYLLSQIDNSYCSKISVVIFGLEHFSVNMSSPGVFLRNIHLLIKMSSLCVFIILLPINNID